MNQQSGGVDVESSSVDVKGDVSGRDSIKSSSIVNEGGPIARYAVIGLVVVAIVAIVAIAYDNSVSQPLSDSPNNAAKPQMLETVIATATPYEDAVPSSIPATQTTTPTQPIAAVSVSPSPSPTDTATPTFTPTPTSIATSTRTMTPTPSPTATSTPSLTSRRIETFVQDANEELKSALLDLDKPGWTSLQQYWCGKQAWKEIELYKRKVKNTYGANVSVIYTSTSSSLVELDGKLAYEQIETWTLSSVKVTSFTESRRYTYIFKATSDISVCIDEYLFSKPINQ